jgi:hypothetical protein
MLCVMKRRQVEVHADHLLEEQPTGGRLVEHLCQRELGLQDREVVAIARRAVLRRKRVRQSREPLAEHGLDLRLVELIGDPLGLLGARAARQAVVQCLGGCPGIR